MNKTGRPRSIESQQAILDATWELLAIEKIKDLTIEAIAKKAKVGKTTIYRWWGTKLDLIVDVFLEKTQPIKSKKQSIAWLQEQTLLWQLIGEFQQHEFSEKLKVFLDNLKDKFFKDNRQEWNDILVSKLLQY